MYEKTAMDRQADQAIADFVEEMEEIYPELADTELQAVVSAAVRDLREQKADQEPFEYSP